MRNPELGGRATGDVGCGGRGRDWNTGVRTGTEIAIRFGGEIAIRFGGEIAVEGKGCETGTSVDAELIGVADHTGTLEAGKLADVVAVPGNPVDDIRVTQKVLFVMKDGQVYKNSHN